MFCKKKICAGHYLTLQLRNSNWTGARRRTTVRRWFFGCAVQAFKNGFLGLIVGQLQDGSGPERPACVPGLVCSTLRVCWMEVLQVLFRFCQSENHLRTSSGWESAQRSSCSSPLTEDVGIRTRGGAEMSHRSHMFCHRTRCDLLQILCALYNFPAWNSHMCRKVPVTTRTPWDCDESWWCHSSQLSVTDLQLLLSLQCELLLESSVITMQFPPLSWLVGLSCEFRHHVAPQRCVSVWIRLLRHRRSSLRTTRLVH